MTTGGMSVAAAGDVDGSLKIPAETMWLVQGARGAPADAQVRFDARGGGFCGGLVSSKNKPKCFCISSNCGPGHGQKVFDQLSDGSYYIIEPAARGGSLGQTLRAFLEPPLPRAAAKYSPDNKEVLQATNSMEGWLSLF